MSSAPGESSTVSEMRRALRLWLEYDRRRAELVAQLYVNREDSQRVQDLLDANEDLREQAISLTRQLLD